MYKAIPNSGFIESEEDERDFIMGAKNSLPREVLIKDGQWDDFRPEFEAQKLNPQWDPYSCTAYALNNSLSFIDKKRYGDENDKSERYTALIAGNVPRKGNSIKNPAKFTKKKGRVDQDTVPYTKEMTEKEYYNKKVLTPEVYAEGLKWLEEYDYGYEKAYPDRLIQANSAMEALRFSPLQTGIDSSTKKKANFRGWNDSVVIYGFEEGKYWKVFGSYKSTTGYYDWDYPFYSPLKFHLKKKLNLINIDNMKMSLIRDKQRGGIYLVGSDNIIHHIEEPTAFLEYFGKPAWDNQDWVNYESEEIDKMKKGEDLSLRKNNLADAIREVFSRLGKRG